MVPCDRCTGKTILGKTYITSIGPDQEPFEADELVELDEIDCDICIDVHYCPSCKTINDWWDDEKKLEATKRSEGKEKGGGLCPLMSRPIMSFDAAGEKLENFIECQGTHCRLWTRAYRDGSEFIYDCAFAVLAIDAVGLVQP